MSRAILNPTHGAAKDGGALLAAEAPPLKDLPPPNAALTEQGLALANARGRPFTRGNRAAAGRGPALSRMGVDIEGADGAARGVLRKAESLRRHRVREMSVSSGGSLSSGVCVELASWALAIAWSRYAYDAGDAVKGAQLAEKASAHQLKAIGIAEREAEARAKANPRDIVAEMLAAANARRNNP